VISKQYSFTPTQVADNLLILARHYEALGCGKESGFACPASDAAAVLFAAERLIPKWVSVSDLLPEDGQTVIACFKGSGMTGQVGEATFNKAGGWFSTDYGAWGASHWMLLPEPPQEAT
jgi:hypothetical protein